MAKKADNSQGWRLPAQHIEKIFTRGIQNLLDDPVKVLTVLGLARITADMISTARKATARLARDISDAGLADMASTLRPMIKEVRVSLYEVAIDLSIGALGKALGISAREEMQTHTITLPVQLKRRGAEMRVILPGQQNGDKNQDETLINLVARAHDWFEQLKAGTSITDIAKAENIHLTDASRFLPLAFLAPDIVTDILDGDHPTELTAEKLKRLTPLPLDWQEQRQVLGFETV